MGSSAFDDEQLQVADVERIRRAVVQLEPLDFERIAPPAGLWEQIAEEVAAEPRPLVIEYRIDSNDVVIDTGAGWASFARHGDAEELAESGAGRSLWSSMDDDARDLWQAVVARVRAEQTEAIVPFRCDGPDVRRWFDMTLTPAPDGSVQFRSVLAWEEPRPAVALLADDAVRDAAAEPVQVCSWCNDAHDGVEWVAVEQLVASARLLEQAPLPPVSYGICPSCREQMSAELLVPGRLHRR